MSSDLQEFWFAGWVPTTTGHLSFSRIGVDRHSRGMFSFKAGKSIFVVQRRKNRDVKVPTTLRAHRLSEVVTGDSASAEDGDPERPAEDGLSTNSVPRHQTFRFSPHPASYYLLRAEIELAQTPFLDGDKVDYREDPKGAVSGSVFVTEAPPWRKWSARFQRQSYEKLADTIWKSRNDPEQIDSIGSLFNEFVDCGVLIKAEFMLFRTGEIRIWLTGRAEDKDVLSGVAEQVYFFIKDSAHIHHHHSVRDDQLLRISPTNDAADDVSWRRDTLWSLAKAAGQLRRRRILSMGRQASGVIEYAKSFQNTLAQLTRERSYPVQPRDKSCRRYRKLATYDFDFQKESIKAANEAKTWRVQGSITLAGILFASTWAFFIAMSRTGGNQLQASYWIFYGITVSIVIVMLDLNFNKKSVTSVILTATKSIFHSLSVTRRRAIIACLIGITIMIGGIKADGHLLIADMVLNLVS